MSSSTPSLLIQKFLSHPEIKFKKGQIVLASHQPVTNIYYLKSGLVRQFTTTLEGQELTIHIFQPGSYFPVNLVIAGQPNRYSFEALNLVTAHTIPVDTVINFLKEHPDELWALSTRLARGLFGIITRLEYALSGSAYHKVSSLLIYFADNFGQPRDGHIEISLPISHQEFGNWLGLARETVSRQFEQLKADGFIEYQGHTIIITNYLKLLEIVR